MLRWLDVSSHDGNHHMFQWRSVKRLEVDLMFSLLSQWRCSNHPIALQPPVIAHISYHDIRSGLFVF